MSAQPTDIGAVPKFAPPFLVPPPPSGEAELELLRQLNADLRASEAEALTDRDLADRECRKLRKEASALRRMLSEAREADPKSVVIREVLEYWKQATNHTRSQIPMDGDRAERVRTALRWGFGVDKLKKAIDGAARYPYVVDCERKSAGPANCRYDEVDTIMRTEKSIEKLSALAHESAHLAARRVWRPSNLRDGEAPIDAFLSRLEGVKSVGPNKWQAQCPAHEDRHPSLSVAYDGRGVGALCFAGCEINHICQAIGLDVTDLFDDDDSSKPLLPLPPPPEPLNEADVQACHVRLLENQKCLDRLSSLRGWDRETIVTLGIGFDGKRITFPVRDVDGALQNVLRYLPGDRPSGVPKLLATKGRPRDLFPAPELLNRKRECWIFEGEPDGITGLQLGLRCCGLPGVKGWRPGWAQRFEGLRVVLCLDCDDAGRNATEKIALSLLDYAKEVRVVDLMPLLNTGYDVSDYVTDGGTAESLVKLAAQATPISREMDA